MPYWTPNEQLMHRRQEQVCKHQKYKLWAHISEAKMDNRLWKAFSVCKVHLPTESAHATISTNQWLSFTHIHNCLSVCIIIGFCCCKECKITLHVSSAMLVGVMPTQLTYCVTFIGYQYVIGWCSRRRHCVIVQVRLTSIPATGIITYQPAISDHLTPAELTTCCASGTLFRRLSDPLTVKTPSRPD